ncbi:hypothetical protein M975_2496 [Buttiauxella brennerae ATCC 51605]|uniref:Lipoprotein n=1 Tax=Buttiauxella brennerae ATCC 51605 TaxID=1354251 RepID=A0A1B7INA5_9ENTR|nr:hypothetical protein [Buttiauxella brennerae]OAT31166.1 hypothetical protein M975_2496 [Buttiauxella brennerae ATCC 51605]
MSYRFALTAMAAVLALTGCTKSKTADQAPAFDFGSSRVTVTHIPTKTDDGTAIYVTIDSKDAGTLGTSESLEVQLPEGKHKVGGYARTLIGRVTIAPVEVSTSSDVISHVTYSVANGKPTFIVRASSPVPKPKSESIPAEPIPMIPKQIEEPEPSATEQTQTQAPAVPVTTPETQEPPKVTELTPTIQAPTESQTSTPQGVSITNLTDTPQA